MIYFNLPILEKPIRMDKMTIFTIQDTLLFRLLVENIYAYPNEERVKLFFPNQDAVKAEEILLIGDLFSYDPNSSTVLKMIYADLLDQVQDRLEIRGEIEQSLASIQSNLEEVLLDSDLDLQLSEPDLVDVFKAFDIRIRYDAIKIENKIFDIIHIFQYLHKKKLLVFINALTFFTLEEVKSIEEYIRLNNVDVLFLETRKVEGVKQYYLDEDYFLFEDMV